MREIGAAEKISSSNSPRLFSRGFLTAIYLGGTLNPINSSLLATALVPIATGLHISVGRTAALVGSLYVASAIAMPTAGKMAQEFGPRRVFLAGALLVAAGGLVGGTGHNLSALVISRAIIGLGTSAAYPCSMLLIRRGAERHGLREPPGAVLGILALLGSASSIIALPIGGVLVAQFGWRSAFFINVPSGLAVFVLGLLRVPKDDATDRTTSVRELFSRLDALGVVIFALMMSELLVFLLSLYHANWVALAITCALALCFVVWELRAKSPFIDLHFLVGNGALTRAYMRVGLSQVCITLLAYGLTQWLESARHNSPEQAGLLILPMSLVAAVISRPISVRNLVRAPLLIGALSALCGSLLMLLLRSASSNFEIAGVAMFFGITLACGLSGNQTVLYALSPKERMGTSSGLFRTFVFIGAISASAVSGVVFHTTVTDHGLHDIGAFLTGVSLMLLALVIFDRKLQKSVHRLDEPGGVTPTDQTNTDVLPQTILPK